MDFDDRPPALREGQAPCLVLWLGTVDYEEAWHAQKALVQARRRGEVGDVILLMEHTPAYTIGRRYREASLPLGREGLERLGIPVYEVDRGGDVTFHGPGQLVGYPILGPTSWGGDAHRYLRCLEEVIMGALADLGLPSQRFPGYTGVWVGEEKVAAIGVRVSGGVTSHGFALNLAPDLSYFAHIIPCGLHGKGVTSVARALGKAVDMREVAALIGCHFCRVFGLRAQGL